MSPNPSATPDEFLDVGGLGETETLDEDLWFLPGPVEDAADDLPTGPRAEPGEAAILYDWRQAEAGLASRLAQVAGRLGGLDDGLRRAPEGWRQRLAPIEAAELSWYVGVRVTPDRLAL